MCRLPLDMGGGVRSCDLIDPYAVVLLVDGTVVLLELCEGGERGEGEGEGEEEEDEEEEDEEEEGEARLQQTWPEIVKVRDSLYVSSPVCHMLYSCNKAGGNLKLTQRLSSWNIEVFY